MLYLAALRAGAVYLPLNTAYTTGEICYFLGDAEPTLFVCDPKFAEALRPVAAKAGVRHVETLDPSGAGSLMEKSRAAAPDFADVDRGRDDLAAIPLHLRHDRPLQRRHADPRQSCLQLGGTVREWHFTSEDRLLHALPIFHTHGLFVAMNITLMAGSSLIFLPGFNADEIIRLLPRATVMMGVPTFYTRLLARPDFTRELVAHVRLFVSGSAPLSAETHKEFEARTGHKILERYGMTETNMNTSNPYSGERIAGSVGFPLPAWRSACGPADRPSRCRRAKSA